jgi:hypothetical protein
MEDPVQKMGRFLTLKHRPPITAMRHSVHYGDVAIDGKLGQ